MTGNRDAMAAHMLAFPLAAEGCTGLAALGQLALATVAVCGMSTVVSAMLTGPSAAAGNGVHFRIGLDRQGGHDADADGHGHDPLVHWAITSGAPARWSDVLDQLPARDPARLRASTGRCGLCDGVVTPVRTAGGHLGMVSVGGAQPRIGAEAFGFLHFVSAVVLRRAEVLRGAESRPAATRFSPRERASVALLVHGLTEREIAHRLGISEVTARFHLDNARHKAGARSRTHLAGIAAGWLAPSAPAGADARCA